MEQPFTFSDLPNDGDGARILLATLEAFYGGDLAVRMPAGHNPASSRLGSVVNDWLETAASVLSEFTQAVSAISAGDLDQPMPLEVNGHKLRGPLLQLAERVNRMRIHLSRLAAEVGRLTHEAGIEGRLGGQASLPDATGAWRDMADNVNSLAASLTSQVRSISSVTAAMTRGDLNHNLRTDACGELGLLQDNINALIHSLRETTRQNAEQDWLKTNLARFARQLQGQRSVAAVAHMVMAELAPLIRMQHGLFYVMDDAHPDLQWLRLTAAYAAGLDVRNEWRLGEGLIGQCAHDRKPLLVSDVPPAYLTIRTGTGAAAPTCLLVQPILFEGVVKAVLELASFTPFSTIQLSFLEQLGESVGVVLHTIEASMRTENLLKQAQSLAQELQSQQEALSNSNAKLHEKAVLLQRQKAAMEVKNREVEITRMSLEEKAEQLMLTSRYKSEFLSSMSHELRTPLNSLLILARQLSENTERNLTPRQVEYAATIYSAGGDLLNMINELLDLAKIESGTVMLDQRDVSFTALEEQVLRMFNPIAQSRGLAFTVKRSPALPAALRADETRLLQIIRNLLSNAFKFTEHGGVTLSIELAHSGWPPGHESLDNADVVIAFVVSDTGIGVAPEQRSLIFQAFQQVDTGTSRRYGGTGLGLSISTGLARLMNGELTLCASEPGAGSSFALYMPQRPADCRREAALVVAPSPRLLALSRPQISDDRDSIAAGDVVVLVISGDGALAAAALEAARAHGYRGVIAGRGSDGIDWLARLAPTAIVLDMQLPDMDGWQVLSRIKRNPGIRHVPLHAVCPASDALRSLHAGAHACTPQSLACHSMDKVLPAMVRCARRARRLLLVSDDVALRGSLGLLLGGDDIDLRTAGSADLAAALRLRHSCIVLHLPGADMAAALTLALQALRQAGWNARAPLLLYAPDDVPPAVRARLRVLREQALVRCIHSEERLLDETALFLHRSLAGLDSARRERINQLYQGSSALQQRIVLVVDDDIRNIFALTGVLERQGMEVWSAENGRGALDMLHQRPNADIVLMDIMMPDMDGFDTMRSIRRDRAFESLPIIAMTAKAMKTDREKCLAAGASDYVSKPVDIEELLALMRRWLLR